MNEQVIMEQIAAYWALSGLLALGAYRLAHGVWPKAVQRVLDAAGKLLNR